ncbi:hypothetical protein GCM10012275_15430 [Longimycelium tulufanense]|uniref:Uncharacterized protein n=1 Tax=Longimycelium tulufanense TaxID=907463 RepID=A0A8J3FVK5_9PSEU|nr:hypothetical protein [Longimycelium tulufanense]GGM45294.1 hypothetical protein GCM10012275_15430 [Longimycelium tulufanense]
MSDEAKISKLVQKLPKLPISWEIGRYGYDWMDAVEESGSGWFVVPLWGSKGWNLGSWPHVIVLHYNGDEVYGVATYVEGDLTIRAYATPTQREVATDMIAHFYWLHNDSGPEDLPERFGDVPAKYFGPYLGW